MYHDAVPSISNIMQRSSGWVLRPTVSNRPTFLNSPAKTPTYREYFARVRPERQ